MCEYRNTVLVAPLELIRVAPLCARFSFSFSSSSHFPHPLHADADADADEMQSCVLCLLFMVMSFSVFGSRFGNRIESRRSVAAAALSALGVARGFGSGLRRSVLVCVSTVAGRCRIRGMCAALSASVPRSRRLFLCVLRLCIFVKRRGQRVVAVCVNPRRALHDSLSFYILSL